MMGLPNFQTIIGAISQRIRTGSAVGSNSGLNNVNSSAEIPTTYGTIHMIRNVAANPFRDWTLLLSEDFHSRSLRCEKDNLQMARTMESSV